jgi:ribosome-associated protein
LPLAKRGSFVTIRRHAETVWNVRQARARDQACLCAKVADDYRGKDTVVLDLTGVTPIVDFFVITTAASQRQMRAIAEEVDRVLSAEGSARVGIEGYNSDSWILQDYGDIVLHVFSADARDVYDLEHLWADAARVDWQHSQTAADKGA